MLNIFKTIDLEEIQDGISELKEQYQELRSGGSRGGSALGFVLLGAGVAVAATLIYRNRRKVRELVSEAGAELKDGFSKSGLKGEAEDLLDHAKAEAKDATEKIKNNAAKARSQAT
ncbi:MAG: hypothetical protein ABIW76_10560 [Fibrobacteria bacterium]